MSEKKNKSINFVKKNAYYFAFIICLAVLSIITVALVVSAENKQVNGGGVIEVPKPDNNGGNNNVGENNGDQNGSDDANGDNQGGVQDAPTTSVIVFDMPVNGTIIKDYVDTSVVYNQTLGLYSGHKAIDFSADENSMVSVVYDGVIESITTGKLDGVTLIVDHGNGLKTVYNSIEVNEDLEVGQSLKKGDAIGVVSTNNRTEYKDGAHLHFEVLEDGKKISPYKYLLIEEK